MTTTNNISDKPPPLAGDFTLPKTRDLPRNQKPWKDVNLPIDIMLLTVKECEFLSCHKLLKNSFKSYNQVLGYIYFGGIGIDEPLKVALIKCQEGANTPSGSTITVKNAVTILQPKAVFAVGYCSGLQRCTTRLGDVVVCSKLTQYASQNVQNSESTGPARVPVSRDMLQLIKDAAAGWNPPLLDPTSREIEVHCDAEYLSGPEHVCSKQRCDELTRLYPNAKAIEMEAEGVYVAAYDLKMEWVVVKGISGYANGTEGNREEWRTFASVMAASVVENMLSDSVVFQSWPHYKGPSYLGAPGPAVVWQASAGSPGMERSESNNTMDTGEPSDLGAPRPAVVLQASAGSPGMERSESNNTMDTGVKDGMPKKEELLFISKNIGVDWKLLGRCLNIEEPELVAFHKENEEYIEKAYQMLLHWKQKEGSDATYQVLHNALRHHLINRKDLADKICC